MRELAPGSVPKPDAASDPFQKVSIQQGSMGQHPNRGDWPYAFSALARGRQEHG